MRTEIRGYLFSIRMFQVRQASDEEKQRYKQEKKKKKEEGEGRKRLLLQLVCYISQYLC